MSRTLALRLSAGVLFLVASWIAYTQNQGKAPPELKINKVKDDLYEIEGDGGNVTAYITGQGVILVDDKFDRDHEQIVDRVKSVTSEPIKYIISTHHHEDHSGGNTKFVSSAEIISTVNAHNNIVEHKQSNATPGMTPAPVTFTDETIVFLNGKQAIAKAVGRGHTNGDCVVYFPADKVLSTGDLMAGTTPLIDYPGGGSLKQWPATLDNAMKFDFDTVIPGHGPVTTKMGLMTYRNNVDKEVKRVAGLVHQKKSDEEIGKVMMAEYGWMPNSLNMQWSLPGFKTEFK